MRRYVTITNRTGSPVTLVGTMPPAQDPDGESREGMGIGSARTQVVPAFGRLVIGEDEYATLAALAGESMAGTLMAVRSHGWVTEQSVRDYGCLGDGMTDDTLRFQSAVDATAERGGGTLRVDAGVYVLSSPGVILHGGVSLQGESSSSCILKQTSPCPCVSIDSQRCTISDLTLVGSMS